MTSIDLPQLARELAVDWQPQLDQNEDYAELTGAVAALPSAEAIEGVVRSRGFEVRRITRRPVGAQPSVVEILGRRESEKLAIVCVPAVPPPYAASGTLKMTWESGRRPAVVGSTVEWKGRAWPVVLDETVVHHRSARMLILEGRAPQGCVERLAAWAEQNGMRPHAPYEPDLAGALDVSDGELTMTLTPRGEWTTLTIAHVEDGT